MLKRFAQNAGFQLANPDLLQTTAFIGGSFLPADAVNKTFPVLNPYSGKTLADVQITDTNYTDVAISAATEAWNIGKWKHSLGTDRAKILHTAANVIHTAKEDLAGIITAETGKPLVEARGEVDYAISFFKLFAEEATRINGDILASPLKGRKMFVLKEPIGPTALITPWNFPCAMVARKVAPAIAAGCTMVLKPSEETPLTALAMCHLLQSAGLPRGVLNCITTDRQGTPSIGSILCASPYIRKLSFTGSSKVGKTLNAQAALTIKKTSLELGGNAPFIVFNDANLSGAIKALMSSKFRNAGQACIAPNRVFVQSEIYEEFSTFLVDQIQQNLILGNGREANTTMGPLINQLAVEKMERHVQDAVQKGAQVRVGGCRAPGSELFYSPTVLTGVTPEMLVFREETFGPIVSIMKFKNEHEVVALANDTECGLAAYFCTRDMSRTFRIAEALEAGMIGINEGAISSAVAPFGGVKQSGLGREGSQYGIDEFCEMKFLCLALEK